MLKSSKLLIFCLVISLCGGNSFAGNASSNSMPTREIQNTAQQGNAEVNLEMGDLSVSAVENSRQSERRLVQRNVDKHRMTKKIAAIMLAAVITSGVTIYAISPFVWPECNTIYYRDSKICSYDKGEMIQYNPGEVERGMYLSIWTTDVMNAAQNGKYINILGDPQKENEVLDFITKNKIDSLAIYDLGVIFDTPTMSRKLSDFIIKAKRIGVKEVVAVGSSILGFDAIAVYQQRYPARFDTLLTEIEFWHIFTETNGVGVSMDQAFTNYLGVLNHIRGLGLTNVVSGKDLMIATYIARIDTQPVLTTTEVAESIIPKVDKIYQTCYGAGDANATRDIVDAIRDCSKKLEVWLPTRNTMEKGAKNPVIVPIFSAEGKNFRSTGGDPVEYFIGDWIQSNPSLDAVEKASNSNFTAIGIDPSLLTGFYYFEYSYLDHYLSAGLNGTSNP